ncbi:MAG: fibrobacter succinogenes major paralogous domain-containing protein [Bacteroidota bacterium]
MKNKLRFSVVLVMGFMLISVSGCKKDDSTITPTPTPSSPLAHDVDGNVYHTVVIGTQTWMVENLKVTHFRNGDPIVHQRDASIWSSIYTGLYTNYNNLAATGETYGRLYNWYAAMEGPVLAPEGWHIPTSTEVQTLIDYLGGSAVAGGKLKESGTAHWLAPNTDGSGFSALPAGVIAMDTFVLFGSGCIFWTATEYDVDYAWAFGLNNGDAGANKTEYGKVLGFSIRCIKDN